MFSLSFFFLRFNSLDYAWRQIRSGDVAGRCSITRIRLLSLEDVCLHTERASIDVDVERLRTSVRTYVIIIHRPSIRPQGQRGKQKDRNHLTFKHKVLHGVPRVPLERTIRAHLIGAALRPGTSSGLDAARKGR